MISFYGMGASNGIDCSQRDTITCSGESNRLFYNPMWTLYSSNKDFPGTHKYARTGEDVVSWHFLDQVIIRPSLIEKFSFDSLSIITNTTQYKFTNKNNKPSLSDHLPIKCELALNEE
ncbi:hypothetical protein [uncultured Tolumonas sp.]|uniref:hypothetical protein n=1 Tax=uncultured Tolumonas sp. TaxID=263765 RepID=UPI002A0A8DBB|nr:hypothetical protein [uncultured Tolumonas sp.]